MAAPTRTTTENYPIGGYRRWAAVTPNDSAAGNFDTPCNALYVSAVGASSTLTPVDDSGTAGVQFIVVVGQIIPISCLRVMSTGTTATVIALWNDA